MINWEGSTTHASPVQKIRVLCKREPLLQPNQMERDFINPIKILELTMPPEDAEHYKLPGIFFSKPCNLFKKSYCWYSTQQTSAISLFFTFCTAADCHCLFVLLSDADCYYWETKGKPSLICPWSHCQQTSATFFMFYVLLLHDADCCCLHPTTSANFLFFYDLHPLSVDAVCWYVLLQHILQEKCGIRMLPSPDAFANSPEKGEM